MRVPDWVRQPKTWLRVLNDPKVMMQVHGVLAIIWLFLAIGTTAFGFWFPDNKYLLAWVIFMSAYANAASHWSAREGAGPSAPPEGGAKS